MSLQEVGSLEFADGCWQGSVLAGVGCSLIRGLFLIYDLLPYIVSWYKQTGSDSSWLQNCPGAGTQPGLARGPKQLSSVYWERLGGRADRNRWLLKSNWKDASESCSGDKGGLNL